MWAQNKTKNVTLDSRNLYQTHALYIYYKTFPCDEKCWCCAKRASEIPSDFSSFKMVLAKSDAKCADESIKFELGILLSKSGP